MLIGSVIAKLLAFVDFFLGIFVEAEVSATETVGGACVNIGVYETTVTPCGMGIAMALVGVVDIGLALLGGVFAGLAAVPA